MTSSTSPSGPEPAGPPSGGSAAGDQAPHGGGAGLAPTILLYTLARLGIVVLVGALLVLAGVPVALAALIGVIVALPLSMVLFRGLRGRLDAALAASGERRATERAALRARLSGEDENPVGAPGPETSAADVRSGESAQRQSDGSGG